MLCYVSPRIPSSYAKEDITKLQPRPVLIAKEDDLTEYVSLQTCQTFYLFSFFYFKKYKQTYEREEGFLGVTL